MFGIGFTELLLVLVVALLVLGPDKLPEVARTMAKAYNELRRTGLDLKRTVDGMNLTEALGKARERTSTPETPENEKADTAEEAGKGSTDNDSPNQGGQEPPGKAT